VAVVIGDNEAQANEVSVKPMSGGEQVRVGVREVNSIVNNLIK
jgi:histidyl-tRNA synthetase